MNRGQKAHSLSRGKSGRRSEGCLRRRIPPWRGCTFSSGSVSANRANNRTRLPNGRGGRGCTPQERLHVRGRVVERPRSAVRGLPLLPTHSWMRRADVLQIVFVEVAVHRNTGLPQDLMILGTR